jgi:hypothetical protein
MNTHLAPGSVLVWNTLHGSGDDCCRHAAVDRSGNVVCAGLTQRPGDTSADYLAGLTMSHGGLGGCKGVWARWTSSGRLLWCREWVSPRNRPARFCDVVATSGGTAWRAGRTTSRHPGRDPEGPVGGFRSSGRRQCAGGWEGPRRQNGCSCALTPQGPRSLFAVRLTKHRGAGTDEAIVRDER